MKRVGLHLAFIERASRGRASDAAEAKQH